MPTRAKISVKKEDGVNVYIRLKDGYEMEEKTLAYIAERAVNTGVRYPTAELLDYFEENCEDKMIYEMCAIEMLIVDWTLMPDQTDWTAYEPKILGSDEKAYLYKSEDNAKFNA